MSIVCTCLSPIPCSAAVAESLNNTLIGGRKRNYYHDDMWNLKYLSKFKWDHLTEKVAYERRVRSQKLRLETMQAKRFVYSTLQTAAGMYSSRGLIALTLV